MNSRKLVRALPALVLASACDIPTQLPIWDMTWNVPVKSTTIAVTSFLPAGITLGPNNTFAVTAPPLTQSLSCGLCIGTAPKPGFVVTIADSSTLPTTFTSGTLAGGSVISVQITNNFGFDPIRAPAAASNGWLRIVVSNGGVSIGRDSINGATGALPPGVTTRIIPVSGTVVGSKRVAVSVTLDSPAGTNPVTMNPGSSIGIIATPNVLVSSATVSLASPTSVNSSVGFDLASIDSAITSRVNAATLLLDITNPMSVGGNLTATFSGGEFPVAKPLTLDPGGTGSPMTKKSIALSGAEIRALLGHDITMTIGGGVSGSNVAVTPASAVSVSVRLQLNMSTTAQ